MHDVGPVSDSLRIQAAARGRHQTFRQQRDVQEEVQLRRVLDLDADERRDEGVAGCCANAPPVLRRGEEAHEVHRQFDVLGGTRNAVLGSRAWTADAVGGVRRAFEVVLGEGREVGHVEVEGSGIQDTRVFMAATPVDQGFATEEEALRRLAIQRGVIHRHQFHELLGKIQIQVHLRDRCSRALR